jgi:dCMP deaminase
MTPKRQRQLDHVFMAMAANLSTMSLATRSKVGAMIVKDGNVKSTGWNGMPSGFPNDELETRKLVPKSGAKMAADFVKHGFTTTEEWEVTTNPLVLHAESNAILKCAKDGSSAEGAYLYVTMSPCPECAKLIIQAGIKKVFFRDKYRLTEGLAVLKRAKIPCVQLKVKEQ